MVHITTRRKATWLAFFLVTFTNFSACAAESTTGSEPQALSLSTNPDTTSSLPTSTPGSGSVEHDRAKDKNFNSPEYNQTTEAALALKQALITLSSLSQSLYNTPSSYSSSGTGAGTENYPSSLLQTFFPNTQGPIASALRILYKLRQKSWFPKFFSWQNESEDEVHGGGSSKKKDDATVRSVKVLDLLEHAIELGNLDALFVLGQVSLLSPTPLLQNLTRSFESFYTHARLTGNATSQVMAAFFYSSGYKNLYPISPSHPLALPQPNERGKNKNSKDHQYEGEMPYSETDHAKALMFYVFAANGGDKGAQMALGFKYWAGVGVNDDCLTSLEWYKRAAEQSMAKFLSGPPGGLTIPLTVPKLSDLAGGAYGLGASAASTGMNAHRAVIKAANSRQAGETWEDVLEYYMFNADRGETDFSFRLGKIFYQGSIYSHPGGIANGGDGIGALPRNCQLAFQYFLRIARMVWPIDNPFSPLSSSKKDSVQESILGYAAASASYLGRMYLRGEGVRRDYALAKMWFERGAEVGERESHNGLGIIYRDGLGIEGEGAKKRDLKKALVHFGVAAGQELGEAQLNIGKLHYNQGELKLATTYFENAIRHGSPIEPYFYLAEIYAAQAQAQAPSPTESPTSAISSANSATCSMAVSFYKLVAETGSWGSDNLMEEAYNLWKADTPASREHAMVKWLIASDRGIEGAQNNLGFVLDQDKTLLRHILPSMSSHLPSALSSLFTPTSDFRSPILQNASARLALTHWVRSAAQRNVDALVKVGDYHFYGLGVGEQNESVRWEKAAAYYQAAADMQVSALAEWNLGWMYENGVGVPQDFHLAKRHYDSALETNSEAYFAVTLSLAKLYIKSIWHTLKGGEGGLPIWTDDSAPPKLRELDSSDSEKSGYKKKGGDEYMNDGFDDVHRGENDEGAGADGYDDNEWYMGRAKEEHEKRMRRREEDLRRRLNGEEDPIEWARERRAAENNDEYYDAGPEDFFDAALRGRRRRTGGGNVEDGEVADEFAETMLLVTLCLIVSVLVWVRGRWIERRRREDERRDGGTPNENGNGDGNNAHDAVGGDAGR